MGAPRAQRGSCAARNVRLTLAFRALDGMASGIWAGSVLSNYISLLFGSTPAGNEKGGVAQAVLGTALAATAVQNGGRPCMQHARVKQACCLTTCSAPFTTVHRRRPRAVGWLADKRVPRHLLLRAAGATALLAVLATLHALAAPAAARFRLLCAALALWGVAQGSGPVLDALFADSVPTGGRASVYTAAQVASLLSRAVGPLLSALLFMRGGNRWCLDVLARVMVTGQLLALAPACLMLFFSASDLGAESEGLSALSPPGAAAAAGPPPGAQLRAQGLEGAGAGGEDASAAEGGQGQLGWRQQQRKQEQEKQQQQQEQQQGQEQHEQQQQGQEQEQQRRQEQEQELEGQHRHQRQQQQVVQGSTATTHGDAAGVLSTGASLEAGRDVGQPVKAAEASCGARSASRVVVWCQSSDDESDALQDAAAAAAEDAAGKKPPAAGPPEQLRQVAGRREQQQPEEMCENQQQGQQAGAGSGRSSAGGSGGVAACGAWWGQPVWLTPSAIPPMLSVSDCISGLASGMTISYFPIFFKDEVGLSPTALCLLLAAVPAGLTLCSVAARYASRCAGRVQTIVAFKATGISLLFTMAVRRDTWARPAVVLPIYVMRTCLMNATPALQKSILMDYAPKNQRGRWSSLDAVTNFGWSGSALLGGVKIRRHGFAAVFLVTSAMQLVSLAMLCTLLPLVPRREAPRGADGAG